MATFNDRLITMVKFNEGVRAKVYKDSLGIPTVGVGLNLTRPDAKATLLKVGADFDAILAGKAKLTDAQIDKLLMQDLQESIEDMQKLFPDFDSFPDDAKLVIIDMRFNLGPSRFRGFANTIKDLKAKKWKSASVRMGQSLWATQVGPRATRSIQMMAAL